MRVDPGFVDQLEIAIPDQVEKADNGFGTRGEHGGAVRIKISQTDVLVGLQFDAGHGADQNSRQPAPESPALRSDTFANTAE